MYYKLYIDSVFLVQFVLNLYLLSITGKILKCTATHGRMILGALLGAAMICLVILLPPFTMKIRLMIGVIPVSMSMIYVVFGVYKPVLLIRCCAVMAIGSFFMGNTVSWLLSRCKNQGTPVYSVGAAALSGCVGYVFIVFTINKLRKNNKSSEMWVHIGNGKQDIRLKALLDTGNHLSEPISGAPVCLISKEAAKDLEEYFSPEKYHAIPYSSVGKNRGIMDAYELPELVIEGEYGEIQYKHIIVAICNTGISKDSAYQMILHPDLIKN